MEQAQIKLNIELSNNSKLSLIKDQIQMAQPE